MSLASLCSTSKGTIKRKDLSSSPSGGRVGDYDTAARGSLPTTITCRVNENSGSRRFTWGEHDQRVDGMLYTITDPQCDERDLVEITNKQGIVEKYFIQYQRNPDQANKFYILGYTKVGRGIQ